MKVKELIEKLKVFGPELEVKSIRLDYETDVLSILYYPNYKDGGKSSNSDANRVIELRWVSFVNPDPLGFS